MSTPATNSKLDAALAYAAKGWAVFRLAPKSKKPIAGTNGFHDATTDSEQIVRWWTETPDANVGIACGAVSDLLVLDVDVKKGKRGDEALAALLKEHTDGKPPETPTATTWSGGGHIFFRHGPGIRSSVRALGEGLDIRADGGYVVAAPSVIRENDEEGEYQWDVSPFDVPSAPVPEWLLDRLRSNPAERRPSSAAHRDANWMDDLLGGVPEGSRDESCWRMACRYARKGLSKAEARQLLLSFAANCTPPFDEEAVHDKIERAYALHDSLIGFPATDSGNAERMVALHGHEFRWMLDGEEWLAWDGRRWAPGSVERVKAFALDTARMLQTAIAKLVLDDDDALPKTKVPKRALMGHAMYSESARGIVNAVQVAKVLPAVHVRRKDLDTNVDVLNVANGTLDLKTFELRAHQPGDLLTKIVDVRYEPDAEAPCWQAFLQEVFCKQQDVIDYVQRAVGYTLTGSIEEQCFFLLHGSGANGKSTFVEAIVNVLGEYATKVDQEALLSPDRKQRGATPELVVLIAKRLAYVNELEDGRQLDEARIKAMTGSERATGRALYAGMQEWQNTAKLWFDLNHLPAFKGVDHGIERRPRVIPFDRKFAEHEQDKRMKERLLAERPGILAWAVAGARAWRERGLDAPEAVSIATRQYVEENNHLPAFVRENYVVSPHGMVMVADLQRDYAGFCESRGEPPLDYQRKVVPYLKRIVGAELVKSKRANLWRGVVARPAG